MSVFTVEGEARVYEVTLWSEDPSVQWLTRNGTPFQVRSLHIRYRRETGVNDGAWEPYLVIAVGDSGLSPMDCDREFGPGQGFPEPSWLSEALRAYMPSGDSEVML